MTQPLHVEIARLVDPNDPNSTLNVFDDAIAQNSQDISTNALSLPTQLVKTITFADIAPTTGATKVIDFGVTLPTDSWILGAFVIVTVPFTGSGTVTVDFGPGAGSPSEFYDGTGLASDITSGTVFIDDYLPLNSTPNIVIFEAAGSTPRVTLTDGGGAVESITAGSLTAHVVYAKLLTVTA